MIIDIGARIKRNYVDLTRKFFASNPAKPHLGQIVSFTEKEVHIEQVQRDQRMGSSWNWVACRRLFSASP